MVDKNSPFLSAIKNPKAFLSANQKVGKWNGIEKNFAKLSIFMAKNKMAAIAI
jgi:hypothetical protein